MSETGRLVEDIPRWTSHDKDGRKDSTVKPRVQSGMRFTKGAMAWCYGCQSEHRRGEPCLVRGKSPRKPTEDEVPCAVCRQPFVPSPMTRGPLKFCGDECYREARAARKRRDYDGRYDGAIRRKDAQSSSDSRGAVR